MRIRFLIFALAILLPILAMANTVTVNALTDDGPGNCAAKCTLRDAILSASPTDNIVFSSSLSYPATIVQNGSELYVFRDVTIVGPGIDALAISGNHQSRIMEVDASAVATISGLTFRDGVATATILHSSLAPAAGGAFMVNAGSALNLSNTLLVANQAADDKGYGANGGAIYADGPVRISDSILSGNSAIGGRGSDLALASCSNPLIDRADKGGNASGGAISTTASLVLSNVIFSDNSAIGGPGGNAPSGTACGAGAGGDARGGALLFSTAYVGFVTAVDNSVVPGLPGTIGTSNVAGAARGTAFAVGGRLFVHNTVLTTDSNDKACDSEFGVSGDLSSAIYAWGSNLDNDSSCSGFDLHADPQLQVTNVFGQQLKVFPRFGSPLVDAATDCLDAEGYALDHDVLGVPRPQDGNLDLTAQCDIGAVEYTDSIFANDFE